MQEAHLSVCSCLGKTWSSNMEMPDAMELIYQSPLALGKSGAERHWTSPAMAAAFQAVINSPQPID